MEWQTILVGYLFPLSVILFGILVAFVGWVSGDETLTGSRRKSDTVKIAFLKFPRPFLPSRLRLVLIVFGLVLILAGVVILFFWTPPLLTAQPSLLSFTYMAGNWNPQMVDLRTASSSGIPVSSGTSLQFFDLWIAVPENAPEYTVKAEIYAGEELVGTTSPIPLIGETAHPGTAQISDVIVEKYNHDTVPEAWRVQPDWTDLDIVLITERGGKAVASTGTTVRLAPSGQALSFHPPLLSFASIVYSINNGPPLVLDLRNAQETGLEATPGDTLTILEIWYSASADSDQTVAVEAFILSDPAPHASTDRNVIQMGIHPLADVSRLTWTVSTDKDNLVLWLLRRGTGRSTVVDELEIPLGGQRSGLVPAGQEPLTASLTGLRYMVSGWDRRMVDLRTASTDGIPVTPGQALQLLDLWASVPQTALGYTVQAEIYASDQLIGSTTTEPFSTSVNYVQRNGEPLPKSKNRTLPIT